MAQHTETPALPTWLLVAPGVQLPGEWGDRALQVFLVPLHPQEVAAVIERKRQHHGGDPAFLRLVAQGLGARDIARQLGITDRSVYRRMAALRDDLGVPTNARAAAELARRGF